MALTDNLISFFELEEASGTRVDSVVASGNDLSDNNTVTQQTGKVGNCAEFTHTNSESLSRASNASLATGDIDFSFAGWIYFTSAFLNAEPIAKDNGSQYEYTLYTNGSSQVRWYVEGTAGSSDILLITGSLTTWYFFAVWHDSVNNVVGGSINDGTPVTASYSGGARSTAHPFALGGSPYFSGLLDQVGFWKKVLSPAEITQLYNGGAGLSYAAMADTPRRLILSTPLA